MKDLQESLECIFFPYLDGSVYAKIAIYMVEGFLVCAGSFFHKQFWQLAV